MKRLILLFIVLSVANAMQGEIIYTVSFPNPQTHYVSVDLEISKPSGVFTDIIMPVWTPGSYKIREFSRHVDSVMAQSGGQNLVVEKQSKNTWRVYFKKGISNLKISYEVYAFEPGVRTSYVDAFQAFIHGVSVFMYADGYQNQACSIRFRIPENWERITVALPEIAKNTFVADNYDLLADSPFALGKHDVLNFEVKGVPHRVAMLGDGNYDAPKIITDFTKIIEKEIEVFGEHPSPMYVVFVQNVEAGGGGLEHLNSQTSVMQRWAYSNDQKYKSFLSLIAHEYFHLWNVKRIRPIELGPFDYSKENYTKLLWVAEGITSYYDDLFLKRSNLYTNDEYLGIVSTSITKFENLPGNKAQTLAESSFDAWIKFYNPDENSDNSSISYYQKGMIISMLIDLEIINRSGGTKKLDDVMRHLYIEYFKTKKRGFTEAEFSKACEHVIGTSITEWLHEMVNTTNPLDYSKQFSYVGLELINQPSSKLPLGVSVKLENGKTLIKFVEIGGPASIAGLSANDEIIAVNGYRVNGDLDEFTNRQKEGDIIDVTASRSGKLLTFKAKLIKDAHVNYKLVKSTSQSEVQKQYYKYWLD